MWGGGRLTYNKQKTEIKCHLPPHVPRCLQPNKGFSRYLLTRQFSCRPEPGLYDWGAGVSEQHQKKEEEEEEETETDREGRGEGD